MVCLRPSNQLDQSNLELQRVRQRRNEMSRGGQACVAVVHLSDLRAPKLLRTALQELNWVQHLVMVRVYELQRVSEILIGYQHIKTLR